MSAPGPAGVGRARKFYSLLLLPVPFLFYFLTCSRTVGSGAPAMHIDTIMRRIVSTHVDCHNITMITGWLFSRLPFEEPAFRINLVSSFYASLAIVFFYAALLCEFESVFTAALGAAFLMISHSLWWHATIIESYAANAFFTSLGILFYVRLRKYGRDADLYALCAVSGLAVFNHVSMGFQCAGAAVAGFARMARDRERAWRILGGCSAAALIGLSPWLAVLMRDWLLLQSLPTALNTAFFGPFRGLMLSGSPDNNLRDFTLIMMTGHPNLFLCMIPVGFIVFLEAWRTSPSALGLLAHLALVCGFSFTYSTWNKFSFAQPGLVILCFIGCFAMHRVIARLRKEGSLLARAAWAAAGALSLAFPPYLYSHVSSWGRDPRSIWHARYNNLYSPGAYRLNEYIANPNKRHFREYDDFARLLFNRLPKGAMFFDDDGRSYYQLSDYFQKQKGWRPDVSLLFMNSFGYDSINWGLSTGSVAEVIRKAYFFDRGFYTISLGPPFRKAIDALPAGERFQFEKFYLDDAHWVYKLMTRKDELRSPLSLRRTDGAGYVPIRFAGKPVVWDLRAKDVLFSARADAMTQKMSAFGTAWRNGNQLLIRFERHDGWVELLIECDRPRLAALGFHFTTSYDYARLDAFVNETRVLSGVDAFSKDIFRRGVLTRPVRLEPGYNRLILAVSKENRSPLRKAAGIDFLELIPVQEAKPG
ncbi:MAG: DUF2723 domain-containing protein [Elusimicrobia bacterium]|nr:DUF2723 domain-containing protein [Elusimicrobiota bacterium]